MKLKLSWLIALLAITSLSLADPKITLSMSAEVEAVEIEDGKQIIKRVPAEMVQSGQEVVYTLNYINQGSETATNVILNNPINENAIYVADSVFGDNADISFSLDGETFAAANNLTVEVQGELVKAAPQQYKAVRWQVKEIPPGSKGTAGFKVKIR